VRSPELLDAAAGTSHEFHAPALSVPLGPYRSLERMHPRPAGPELHLMDPVKLY
jgi:hypothetical protein